MLLLRSSRLLQALGNEGAGCILLFVRTAAFLEGEESRPQVVILLKKKHIGFFT